MIVDAHREWWRDLARVAFAIARGEVAPVRSALEHCRTRLDGTPAATADSVREAILQTVPYSGFPGAIEAFAMWDGLGLPSSRRASPSKSLDEWRAQGSDTFVAVYGSVASRVLEQLAAYDSRLRDWILSFAYGQVMAGGALPLVAIEAIGVASLIGQSSDGDARAAPLRSHLRGALRAGWTNDELRDWLDDRSRWCGAERAVEVARGILAER